MMNKLYLVPAFKEFTFERGVKNVTGIIVQMMMMMKNQENKKQKELKSMRQCLRKERKKLELHLK